MNKAVVHKLYKELSVGSWISLLPIFSFILVRYHKERCWKNKPACSYPSSVFWIYALFLSYFQEYLSSRRWFKKGTLSKKGLIRSRLCGTGSGEKYKQEKRILEISSPNEDRDLPLISSVIPAGRRVKRGNKEKELWKQSRGRPKGGLVLKGGGSKTMLR